MPFALIFFHVFYLFFFSVRMNIHQASRMKITILSNMGRVLLDKKKIKFLSVCVASLRGKSLTKSLSISYDSIGRTGSSCSRTAYCIAQVVLILINASFILLSSQTNFLISFPWYFYENWVFSARTCFFFRRMKKILFWYVFNVI